MIGGLSTEIVPLFAVAPAFYRWWSKVVLTRFSGSQGRGQKSPPGVKAGVTEYKKSASAKGHAGSGQGYPGCLGWFSTADKGMSELITLPRPYGFVRCVGVWLRYKDPAQREKEASI